MTLSLIFLRGEDHEKDNRYDAGAGCDLYALLLKLLHKQEIFDEGMVLACYLSCKTEGAFRGFLAMKLITMIQLYVLYAAKFPHKVEMPIAATKLAICNIAQSVRLLLPEKAEHSSTTHLFHSRYSKNSENN